MSDPDKKVAITPSTIIIVVLAVLSVVLAGVVAYKILQLTGILGTKPKTQTPVTLTYWSLWEPDSVIRPLIDEFEQQNPNVKINLVAQSSIEYRERLQNVLSQGKGPDIFRVHNTWLPMFKSNLSIAPTTVMPLTTFKQNFYPVFEKDLTFGGNVLALPLMADSLIMYVNHDLFDQLGEPIPTNWLDFRKQAKSLTVCEGKDNQCVSGSRIVQAGAAMGTADNVDHWQDILGLLLNQNDLDLNKIGQTSSLAEEVFNFYTDFVRSDLVWDATLPNSTSLFAAGKLAFYFAPSWRAHELRAVNPNLNFKTYTVPQPPLDASRGEKPVYWSSYWAEAVNKQSANSDMAWKFVSFLSQDEALQKMYANAVVSGRAFGEIYPKPSLANLLEKTGVASTVLAQLPQAKTWYLASNTFDGPTGINSKLAKYFADAVNSFLTDKGSTATIDTLTQGVSQVLSQYGITR